MKTLFICCAVCCFIAVFKMPIKYYTLLRIFISIGALYALYESIRAKDLLSILIATIIFVLFNPLFPVYLHKKAIWIPMDILTGLFFLWVYFKRGLAFKSPEPPKQPVTYTRDRIISSFKNQKP